MHTWSHDSHTWSHDCHTWWSPASHMMSHNCHVIVLFSPHMQHYTFYDFITNKARGKSGPLFSFDVHEDVRLLNDAAVEKDEVRETTVILFITSVSYLLHTSHTPPYSLNLLTHTHTHTVPCWKGGAQELVRT